MSFPETFTWIFDIWTPAKKYILELRDSAGDLVAVLENAFNISYTQAVNEAPNLSFDFPADDTKEANLVYANEIWIRDFVTGDILKKFKLSRREDARI